LFISKPVKCQQQRVKKDEAIRDKEREELKRKKERKEKRRKEKKGEEKKKERASILQTFYQKNMFKNTFNFKINFIQ